MSRALNVPYVFLKSIFCPAKYPERYIGCKHTVVILETNYYRKLFMKCLVITNYIFLLVLLKLGAHLLLYYNIGKNFIDSFPIMEPEVWEYVWLVMVAIMQLIGWISLLFYKSGLMKVYCFGIYVSIVPLIWPLFTYSEQVRLILTSLTPGVLSGFKELLWQQMSYIPFLNIENNQQIKLWEGFPREILVYELALTAALLHLCSGYYGQKLVVLHKEHNRIENKIDKDTALCEH